jgi:hypothetical protein
MGGRVLWHQAATATVVCFVSLTGYLALLGWDQKKTVGPDGYQHGPYDPWQVVALCVVVGVAAAWAGWRRDALVGAIAATMTMTAAFSIDAATDSENDGLWPVGACMVLVATFFGFWLCTNVGAWFREHRQHSRPR